MVKTFGPTCCSTCRLNCWMRADLNFGASATKPSPVIVSRAERFGAVGVGKPSSKTPGAPIVAHVWVLTAIGNRCSCSLQSATARSDWQDGAEDGREWSVLQVGIRGVVAGEEAQSVAAANNEGRRRRERESEPRSDIGVIGRNVHLMNRHRSRRRSSMHRIMLAAVKPSASGKSKFEMWLCASVKGVKTS